MPSTQNKTESDNKISHYRLEKLLVEQVVSGIYLAQDEKSNNLVFLITLQPDTTRSGDLVERFQRRAETLAQLTHEVIPPLLDYGVDGKRPYAVMAYFPGQFLAERLQNTPHPDPHDKTKIVESLQLVKRIASGLTITHPAGLIHHDLRPENIYLDESGQSYLLDLVVPPTSPITTQLGDEPQIKLDYQSPEQLAGKALSGRSNIYSLGILLYRLLAGHRPALPVSEWDIFEHKGAVREVPLTQAQPGLTAATYKTVQDSIWQKEWSRFETVNIQLQAIEQAITEESVPPPPPPFWLLWLRRLRRSKALRIIIPVIVLLFLLLLFMMFIRGRANRRRNVTPTPEPTTVPAESGEFGTAVFTQAGEDPPTQLVNTPTVTTEVSNEATANEVEVLPSNEEVETPTVRPSPTAVTATATISPKTATPSSTPQATSTTSPTDTITSEPTQTSCILSPPFGWVRYSIQANDSLSSLSEAAGTTVERLMEVNCLDGILLNIGQQIWLPSTVPTATATELATTTPSATAVPAIPPSGPNPSPLPTIIPSLTPPPVQPASTTS